MTHSRTRTVRSTGAGTVRELYGYSVLPMDDNLCPSICADINHQPCHHTSTILLPLDLLLQLLVDPFVV